ncbi:hypothetical protein M419DRAFT_102247 [Trichoderma reesei RUT C-30]|uniref:Uncharacterized protein n=1 Tax=Hypocrea jecorina (strain ATCC 56765 / BCRC 32924 / NRRL 11460 / Rut C-30) TaxID=1344414 RepID=A0A024S5S5_HYPJR|nr:hypothetical protein M419DRAFT_102247 [Trichoderma reesei RUT C-30]
MALPSESPPKEETPLDTFFLSFSHQGFVHNPAKSPVNSWKDLCKFQSWTNKPNDHPPKQKAWKRYQAALIKEVELYFGDVDDITAWKTVCRAVGCENPPDQISKCKAILRNTHVNIVDLIHWARRGGEEAESNTAPEVFKSVRELKDYTFRKHRVFEQEQLMEYNGGNVVLRHLMRRLFSR